MTLQSPARDSRARATDPTTLSRGSKLCSLLLLSSVMWLTVWGLTPSEVRAEADTLAPGDISLLLYEGLEPYNRYWYYYDGARTCGGKPCSRFLYNSYEAFQEPQIGNERPELGDVFLSSTGLRGEFGVLENLTLSAETQLVYRTPTVGSALVLGDSRLGGRWRFSDGPVLISFGGSLKLPGNYTPTEFSAPGNGQPDLEFKTLLGGLALRRKLFYDFSFGYRIRFPYPNPAFVTYGPATSDCSLDDGDGLDGGCQELAVTGPGDEVFADLSVGYFLNRSVLLFTNLNAVNMTKGRPIDDYFTVLQYQQDSTYQVNGDPGNLLTDMEEDYLRFGLGAMFKPMPSMTVYVNYSYIILGRNIPAFYVVNDVFPVGSFSFGVEYTLNPFKKEAARPAGQAKQGLDLRNDILTARVR